MKNKIINRKNKILNYIELDRMARKLIQRYDKETEGYSKKDKRDEFMSGITYGIHMFMKYVDRQYAPTHITEEQRIALKSFVRYMK
jgi:hypothetical protein